MSPSPRSLVLRSKVWKWPLLSIVCAAGMWIYADRVLIPYQISEGNAHERPRGNLSDLYPRWLGARELLLHGRNPYSAEVSREIQAGYYGRTLDPSRPNDPRDEQGFAYPVYVVFYVAPTIGLPFVVVQKGFFYVLFFCASAATMLWLRVLHWPVPVWAQISMIALTLGSLPAMQGLKLQQMSLLVAGLIAAAMALLVDDHLVGAGALLGLATIKPQLVVLLVVWLALWVTADWRRRYPLAISFVATMAILVGASEWYLPHWITQFWQAVRSYQQYTGARSVMNTLIGAPWSWALEFFALGATIVVCWKERCQPLKSGAFGFTLSLVLATTILIVPTCAPYNQVLLVPALLLLFKEHETVRSAGIAIRVLFAITVGLVVWPWLSSVVLSALSFLLPRPIIERGWATPFWTTTQIPMALAALMLMLYYQRAFISPSRAPAS